MCKEKGNRAFLIGDSIIKHYPCSVRRTAKFCRIILDWVKYLLMSSGITVEHRSIRIYQIASNEDIKPYIYYFPFLLIYSILEDFDLGIQPS